MFPVPEQGRLTEVELFMCLFLLFSNNEVLKMNFYEYKNPILLSNFMLQIVFIAPGPECKNLMVCYMWSML
jgi:hypothetical protein